MRRSLIFMVLLVVAVLGATVFREQVAPAASMLAADGSSGSAPVQRPGTAAASSAVSTSGPHVVASVSVEGSPHGLALSGGGLWVARHRGTGVVKIDPATNKVVAEVNTVLGQPGRLTVGAGSLWLANYSSNSVTRIDPVANAVLATVRTAGEVCCWPAYAGGDLWVASGNHGAFAKIDPATNKVVGTVSFPPAAVGGLEADGSLWISVSPPPTCKTVVTKKRRRVHGKVRVVRKKVRVCSQPADPFQAGRLARIDPATGKATRLAIVGVPLGFAAGTVWVATPDSRLLRVSTSTNAVVASIKMPQPTGPVVGDESGVWTVSWSDSGPGTLYRIDPQTNQIVASTVLTAGSVADLAPTGDGGVWASLFDDDRVVRVEP
ncbi:MAG: hypothetical protein C5B48_03720 [Candidatus Rokuibacteriota bacterium]|nr:MAG: hypothetical protein C5B48_03720 [Candidatus Rokubacteria bacterium]